MEQSTAPYALVVDDDGMVRMHACDILEEAGFRTYEALDADEARVVLKDVGETITLLFSDIEMPGEQDGIGLAHFVAEHWSDIEIVLTSGRVKVSTDQLPPRATFIGKPFSADLVKAHLAEALPDGKKPEPLKTDV